MTSAAADCSDCVPTDDLEAEQERKTNNPSKLFIVFITILIRPGHVRRAAVAGLCAARKNDGVTRTGRAVFLHNRRAPQPTAKIYLRRSSVRLCSKNDTAARFDGKTISVCRAGRKRSRRVTLLYEQI